jgi:hypothetical protein
MRLRRSCGFCAQRPAPPAVHELSKATSIPLKSATLREITLRLTTLGATTLGATTLRGPRCGDHPEVMRHSVGGDQHVCVKRACLAMLPLEPRTRCGVSVNAKVDRQRKQSVGTEALGRACDTGYPLPPR